MQTRTGFTLIELLIVFGLMAIFAGFAVVVVVPAIRNTEFDRARATVRNELIAAQADTVAGTLDSAWGVAITSATSVTRYRGTSYAARNTAYDLRSTFSDVITVNGTPDVPFSRPYGLPTSTATIVISSDQLHATATVNTVGAIIIQ